MDFINVLPNVTKSKTTPKCHAWNGSHQLAMMQGTRNHGSASMDVRKSAQSVSVKPNWKKKGRNKRLRRRKGEKWNIWINWLTWLLSMPKLSASSTHKLSSRKRMTQLLRFSLHPVLNLRSLPLLGLEKCSSEMLGHHGI